MDDLGGASLRGLAGSTGCKLGRRKSLRRPHRLAAYAEPMAIARAPLACGAGRSTTGNSDQLAILANGVGIRGRELVHERDEISQRRRWVFGTIGERQLDQRC